MSKADILFILGSHRRKGNSEKILQIIKNHPQRDLFQPHFVFLADKKIENCRSCYQCSNPENKECIIDDDVHDIVNKMKTSDIIIYVPVIYAFSSSSIFQAFLERSGFGYLRPQGRPLRNKFASVVVVGRRYGHDMVASQVISNILLNQMIMVGSGFLPLMQGRTFPGEIEKDEEAIKALEDTITRLLDCYISTKGVWPEKKKRISELLMSAIGFTSLNDL